MQVKQIQDDFLQDLPKYPLLTDAHYALILLWVKHSCINSSDFKIKSQNSVLCGVPHHEFINWKNNSGCLWKSSYTPASTIVKYHHLAD